MMKLTPLDEAEMLERRAATGRSQRQIAAELGCSQSHVSKRLALLRLHPTLRDAVADRTLEIGEALRLAKTTDLDRQLAEFRGMQERRTAVYRHFDADRVLLYVGISDGLGGRTVEHGLTAEWTRYVDHSVAVWFDNRPAARRAESEAIRVELPLFNRSQAQPGTAARRAAYVAVRAGSVSFPPTSTA